MNLCLKHKRFFPERLSGISDRENTGYREVWVSQKLNHLLQRPKHEGGLCGGVIGREWAPLTMRAAGRGWMFRVPYQCNHNADCAELWIPASHCLALPTRLHRGGDVCTESEEMLDEWVTAEQIRGGEENILSKRTALP